MPLRDATGEAGQPGLALVPTVQGCGELHVPGGRPRLRGAVHRGDDGAVVTLVQRFHLIPDPYPAYPAQFTPLRLRVPAAMREHEAGTWVYGNRLSAPGCRCGLAWGTPWGHPLAYLATGIFDTRATVQARSRAVRQHVRSALSRVAGAQSHGWPPAAGPALRPGAAAGHRA